MSTLPDVESLTAIDQDDHRLARARAAIPGLQTARHLESVLDKLDALVIATPAHTHASLGNLAMNAGVSVLIEKPMATTTADAESLLSTAALNRTTLMVGHTFEYNAAVLALRDLLRFNELGDVLYVDSARLNLGLYQPDVNVIWDLAPHDLSIVNFLLDEQPTTVRAWGSRHANADNEDVAYVQLQYADTNRSAQIHVSWLDPCKVRRVTVVGSEKMAVYNDLNADEPIRIYDKGLCAGPPGDVGQYPVSYRYGAVMSPYVEFEEPLLVEDRHFLECVTTNTRPRSDGMNGLQVVQMLEAATEALRTGGPVELRQLASGSVGR